MPKAFMTIVCLLPLLWGCSEGKEATLEELFVAASEGSIFVIIQNTGEASKTKEKAEQGDARSQFELGGMYYSGLAFPRDYQESAKWYAKAAEQGSADAQSILCMMYSRGKGVAKNHEEAAKWCRLIAEQGGAMGGGAMGQAYLGLMYREGLGVPQDYRQALKWSHLAAEQGSAAAQYNLGWMYRSGKGIAKDYIRAYMWVILSIKNTIKNGGRASFKRERDFLIEQMTPAQIDKAKKLARECEAKSYKNC